MEDVRAIQQFGVMLQQQAILNVQQAIQLVQQPIADRRCRRRRRRWWTRPWLTQERRLQFGQYITILAELREGDTSSFKNYMRMTPEMYDELLQRLAPRLQKSDTNWRKALDPGLKLAVTIRHLAAGDSYPSLSYDFRVARTTISLFIPEICEAIVQTYSEEVIPIPNTPEEWKPIAEEFERKWNVPHACGALDGKHIALRKPRRSGSEYYNYKGFFSIVLMALVDANYRFLWIDVGGHGHMSDAQIYNNSELSEMLEDGTIGFPPSSTRHHQSNAALSPTSHRLTNNEIRQVTGHTRPASDQQPMSSYEYRLATYKFKPTDDTMAEMDRSQIESLLTTDQSRRNPTF